MFPETPLILSPAHIAVNNADGAIEAGHCEQALQELS